MRFFSHISHDRVLSRVPLAIQFLRPFLHSSLIFCSTESSMMTDAVSALLASLFRGTSKVSAIQLVPNIYLWNEFTSQHINGSRTVSKNFPPNHYEHLWNMQVYNRKAKNQECSVCLIFRLSSLDDGGHWVTNLDIKGSPCKFMASFSISKAPSSIELPLDSSCSQGNAHKDMRSSSLAEAW